MPKSDYVIATAWPTAYFVHELPRSKGKKVYFVRGIETWSGPENKVLKTYNLDMPIITTSKYLESKLLDMGVPVIGRVPNGIELTLFYPDERSLKRRNGRRVLMMYHELGLKGVKDGIEAIQEANKEVDIELVMFGTAKFPRIDVGRNIEYHPRPFGAELRRLYSTCDVFLWPSRSDGWGQPPMEALACKCALVATNVGGIPEFTIPGKTALIADTGDIQTMSKHLVGLLKSENRLVELQEKGHEYVKKFTWEKSAKKLLKILGNL